MAQYTRWPLEGYEDAPPLSEERNADGKSLVNPAREGLSEAYREFPEPLRRDQRGGFDVHVYYFQYNEKQTAFARALWERIRREFPELQVYRFWDRPIGPHPVAMFEVDLATPEQFGAFVPWLAVWRGDLSVLVHPNTDAVQRGPDGADEPKWVTDRRDHTDRAIWLGQRVPLDTAVFRPKQLP